MTLSGDVHARPDNIHGKSPLINNARAKKKKKKRVKSWVKNTTARHTVVSVWVVVTEACVCVCMSSRD